MNEMFISLKLVQTFNNEKMVKLNVNIAFLAGYSEVHFVIKSGQLGADPLHHNDDQYHHQIIILF